MTDYELTENAVQVTNPAIKDADRDFIDDDVIDEFLENMFEVITDD